MPGRSRFNAAATHKLGQDDGVVLFSMTEIEEKNTQITVNNANITDLSGMTITATILEGDNDNGSDRLQVSYRQL